MGRGYRDNDSRRYFDWLYYANVDLIAAKTLLGTSVCSNSVAFHCQQAVEKALKGYLLFHRHRLYDGHNLPWLCKQAMQEDPHFEQWFSSVSKLNRFYIEARYPADFLLQLSEESTRKVLLETSDIMEFVMRLVHFDFASYRHKKNKPVSESDEGA